MVWPVDDLKISYESKKIFNIMGKWINKTYESLFENGLDKMNISRGKIHEYLGMILDFSEPEEVKITMIPYIE